MSIGINITGRERSPRRGSARRRVLGSVALLLSLTTLAAACGGDDDDSSSDTGDTSSANADAKPSGELRLGYFPNVTHAPAIIGVEDGLFADALGDAKLTTSTYNSGTEASEAILTDSIDATFIGPNPAINAFAESDGQVVIVSGTTSGGASLVVRDGIDSPEDLEGTKLATPSLGNTQDVALRSWLKGEGYATDQNGGGDVSILPQDNADTLTAFVDGNIDGAWVPEPWATRLVDEGGGHVLVDEADLWPEGQFVTTHLIVRTDYLDEHPDERPGAARGPARRHRRRQRRRRGRPRRPPTTASRPSPTTASKTPRSPAPGRTSSSPPTRSPRRCRSPRTTRSRPACSTTSSSTASTTCPSSTRCWPSVASRRLPGLTPDVSAATDPLTAAAPDVSGAPAGAGDPSSAPAGGVPADRPQPRPSAVSLRGVSKVYGTARNAVVALERIDLDVAAGRVRVRGRRLGVRQVHPAQPGRRARRPHGGHGATSRAAPRSCSRTPPCSRG